ncbi:hnh endonuclease [Nannochloropsis oceanica]
MSRPVIDLISLAVALVMCILTLATAFVVPPYSLTASSAAGDGRRTVSPAGDPLTCLAAAKKKSAGNTSGSGGSTSAATPSSLKKRARKGDEGQAQLRASFMKTPDSSATRADFGLSGPGFEMELLPPINPDAGPVTSTSGSSGKRDRKGGSSSTSTSTSTSTVEEEHTTDHHLRLLRQTGKYPVLVLNTDAQPLSYLPLSIIRWQEAIKAIFLERVTVLAYYDSFIQSTAGPWQLPSVICLKQYQKGCRERPPPLNRRNIYIRDHYLCAYCTQRLKATDLTLDHVLPRSKGGKGSWDNLVTCCRQCNRRKGKRTVKELKDIGMVLMNPPRKPKMSELQRQARLYRTAAGTFPHESWQTYLGGPPEDPEGFP